MWWSELGSKNDLRRNPHSKIKIFYAAMRSLIKKRFTRRHSQCGVQNNYAAKRTLHLKCLLRGKNAFLPWDRRRRGWVTLSPRSQGWWRGQRTGRRPRPWYQSPAYTNSYPRLILLAFYHPNKSMLRFFSVFLLSQCF